MSGWRVLWCLSNILVDPYIIIQCSFGQLGVEVKAGQYIQASHMSKHLHIRKVCTCAT